MKQGRLLCMRIIMHFNIHPMMNKLLIVLMIILAYSCSNRQQKIRFNPKAIELDNKAADLMAKGSNDSALLLLDKALQIDSSYYPAYGLKASIYINNDLPDSAISQLEKEIKLKPDFAEAWTLAGMLYDRQGDALKAKEYYEKSITLYDKGIETPIKTGKNELTRSNRLNRAFNMILAGQKQKGRKEALQLKQEEPNNFDTLIINGLLTKTRQEILNDYIKK
jgi:tetratricopeptide (TPR) repeat protein